MRYCLQNLKSGGWFELNDVAMRSHAEDGCGEGGFAHAQVVAGRVPGGLEKKRYRH